MKRSTPFVIEKYTTEIVSLALAKEYLRMDIPGYTGEDSTINAAIKAAINKVETACNLQLGISEYQWNTHCRPCDFSDVYYVKEIISIRYHNGTSYVTVPDSDYELVRIGEKRSVIEWNEGVNIDSHKFELKFKAGFAVPPDMLLLAVRALLSEDFAGDRGDRVSEKKTLSDKLMADFQIGYAG